MGNITCRDIGPRTRVYAEPESIDAAAAEFGNTEAFVAAGEELVGPYVWGRYDLLLMPPAFNYGGMGEWWGSAMHHFVTDCGVSPHSHVRRERQHDVCDADPAGG